MQPSDAIRLGVENLNVVRQVGRLWDGVRSPAGLLNDCGFVMVIDRILEQRGRDTVRVTKV